jgi:hypothetical protein
VLDSEEGVKVSDFEYPEEFRLIVKTHNVEKRYKRMFQEDLQSQKPL